MIEITHTVVDKLTWFNKGHFRDTRSGKLAAKHKIEKLERCDGVCQNRYFISSYIRCTKCNDGVLAGFEL